jgi:TniQ
MAGLLYETVIILFFTYYSSLFSLKLVQSPTQLQSMLMLKKISLYLRTRLCALCYREEPFHRLNWQRANVTECDRHGCELLSMCPQCGIDFKLPALWAVGECEQCSLPFAKMNDFHRSAERSFSSYIF